MVDLNTTENLSFFSMSQKVPPHLISVMLQRDYSIWTINRHIPQTVSHGETI